MRAARRRHRESDALASPDAIRAICRLLQERMPDTIPSSEKQLMRFLFAVRHVERRPATDTKRGRPSRWPREKLREAASQIRGILERETSGRISVSSFIAQYLPILEFPSDVVDALSAGQVNLQEAAHLARLTQERMKCSAQAVRAQRMKLLKQHLAVQGSQTRLRACVKELLGEVSAPEISSGSMAEVLDKTDELLEIDPSDSQHMFWEEMKRLFYAMREIRPEDLDEGVMEEFLSAIDQVSNVLYKIEKRRHQRTKQVANLKL